MTTYQVLLPTMLGVVAMLPSTSSYALPKPPNQIGALLLAHQPAADGMADLQQPLPSSLSVGQGAGGRGQGNSPLLPPPRHLPTQDSGLRTEDSRRTQGSGLSSDSELRTEDSLLTQDFQLTQDSGLRTQDSQLTQDSGLRTEDSLLTQDSGLRTEDSLLTQDSGLRTQDSQLTQDSELSTSDEVRILTPQPGVIRDRSTSLILQYPTGMSIQIRVNGRRLDPETPTQIEPDPSQKLITQTWYNIPLKEGENVIAVQAGDRTPLELRFTVQSTAANLEISPIGDPRVRADGRSSITFEGKITDANGQPLSEDAIVTLTASAGQFVGADQDEDAPGFQVIARKGQFTAQLQSTLQAQQVRIRAAVSHSDDRVLRREFQPPHPTSHTPHPTLSTQHSALRTELEAYTQVEFIPNLRPSIVSGYANLRVGPGGTNYWGSLRDFLNPDQIDRGYGVDLDAAVFATGPIGDWLFTGAFNSSRALNRTCDGSNRIFGGIQFCEQQYPVYGDSSTVDYLTPSKDSFYVRLERASRVPGAETDYIMWGDYYTQEFARASQLYTATNRALHGFKANYNFGNLQATVLFSPDIEGFQRDTIPPNGTSGYYFLSRRLVIPGSETIFLETEEINRPGTVINRQQLQRGSDYEIDYDRGSLLFRRPILPTEFEFFGTGSVGTTLLVRRIVATYQFEGGEDTNLYAARLQYNFSQPLNSPSWLGVTYWREDNGMRDFELYGLDFFVPIGGSGENQTLRGQILGEYAYSRNNFIFRGQESASAYRLEANLAFTDWLLGRAYYRSVEENFANNATVSFTPGQTRYGAQLAARLTNTTSLEIQYDREDNFGFATARRTDLPDLFNPGYEARPGSRLDNSLTTISAGVVQRIGKADFSLNYVNRSREDRMGDLEGDANQLISRLNVPITRALTFRAQNELNLGNDSDPLYPNRTTLGLDWAVSQGVTVRLAHQFFEGGILDRNSITSLGTTVERELWKNTTLTSRYSIINAIDGMTGQGALGVQSRWAIAPGLRLLLAYEHIFNDIFTRTGAGPRFRQPYAIGQTAASLGLEAGDVYAIGLEYTDNPDFKASSRFEYRTGGSSGDNMVISAAAAGRLSPSLTALFRYEQANSANQLLQGLRDTINLRVGMAYRDPNNDTFNGLMRYEFRRNPYTTPDTLLIGSNTDSTDHVFALEGIYAPNWRWEFYGKSAFRISSLDLASNFSNSTTTYLAQARATYRLGYRTDVAGEVRWIGQPDSDYSELGWAAEFGYYLTPDLRLGVGYSFGSVDDRDFSGYRSEGGPYFQLTFKVNELFGGFGRQRVVPRQQQEIRVEPVASMTPTSQNAPPPDFFNTTEVNLTSDSLLPILETFNLNSAKSPPSDKIPIFRLVSLPDILLLKHH